MTTWPVEKERLLSVETTAVALAVAVTHMCAVGAHSCQSAVSCSQPFITFCSSHGGGTNFFVSSWLIGRNSLTMFNRLSHLSSCFHIFVWIIISAPTCLGLPCNLTDPTLNKCLHIFLERDYSLVEQILYDIHTIKEGNELTEYVCR